MNDEAYTGRRILEAMHKAVKYSDAVQTMIETAIPKGVGKLLEFGAGDGAFVKRFEAKGLTVDCVEIDDGLRAELGSRKVFATIQDVPDASYDFIYSVNVLEHIADLVTEVRGLRRVLNPGGILFVFVPAFNALWTTLDDEVGHVQRFTKTTLRVALLESGFSPHRLHYFDSLGFPAALAVKLLERIGLFQYSGGTVGFYDRYVFPVSKILDRLLSPVIGKNVIAVAR
jgi:SAM-dependent methyltransferase